MKPFPTAAWPKTRALLLLPVVLCLQALLLFHNLDLLPAWGDEVFTLQTVAHPIHEIVPILQRDIHPPVYYFVLHWWAQLPLPWTGIAALRAFSALTALLCTWMFDRLWLRRWRWDRRLLALALFAFSPCLLLYGRMARSYGMQAAVAMLAISLLWRWMFHPRESVNRVPPAFAAVVLLLYTHYLPGLAILSAFSLAAWKRLGPARVAWFVAAAALAYAPWIVTLAGAMAGWGRATGFQSHYALAGSMAIEQVLKIGFGLISMTIGESFSPLALPAVPIALWMAWRGCRIRTLGRPLWPLISLAAAAGYAGAARWVTWPFVAARLLWLLPFLTLAVAIGLTRGRHPFRHLATAAILVSFASSAFFYFRRENFVNLGYVAPVREIAVRIRAEGSARDLVLVDGYNADANALRLYLGNGVAFFSVMADTAVGAGAAAPAAQAVWVVRNTRDVSPGRLVSAVEAEACRNRASSQTLYDPYAAWQRRALRLVTGAEAPEYFYQVTVCR